MAERLADLSTEEFEALMERVVDRSLQVWLTQMMDALVGAEDEDEAELKPAFEASLRRSLDQARNREGVDLHTFRTQIGR